MIAVRTTIILPQVKKCFREAHAKTIWMKREKARDKPPTAPTKPFQPEGNTCIHIPSLPPQTWDICIACKTYENLTALFSMPIPAGAFLPSCCLTFQIQSYLPSYS